MFLSFRRHAISVGGRLIGVEKSDVGMRDGSRYLTRWILYTGFGTLRLHKFYRGDDDRASHTHPWWFITFPLGGYEEQLYLRGQKWGTRIVRPWRFHYRPANFEHIVMHGVEDTARPEYEPTRQNWMKHTHPFYTIVLTGHRVNNWGFYPEPDKFIPWRDYDG